MQSMFVFNDTATTEIDTLSLHDALPISAAMRAGSRRSSRRSTATGPRPAAARSRGSRASRTGQVGSWANRSEEHTSELQSRQYLVCRLLLATNDTKLVHLSHVCFLSLVR